jgi:hypothetical protein
MNNPNFKTKKIVLCLLFLGVIMFTASSTYAASETIYVSTQGNDNWNGLSATYDPNTGNGPKATIQNAIDTIPDNGTINIAAGTYKENLLINKNVNLIGAGQDSTIIDGQQANSVISFYGANYISQFTLTLIGFTITNGKSKYGGGIYNVNGNIYLENTKITNNIVTDDGKGGGVYNSGIVFADSLTIITGNYHTSVSGNIPDNVYGNPILQLTS